MEASFQCHSLPLLFRPSFCILFKVTSILLIGIIVYICLQSLCLSVQSNMTKKCKPFTVSKASFLMVVTATAGPFYSIESIEGFQ